MKVIPSLTIFFASLLSSVAALAGNPIKVSGTITDAETGEPLIGVSIIEKGSSTNGSLTDVDGKYSITVPDDAVLEISYIGYKTVEEIVSGRSLINVRMAVQSELMDEIVVVGYSSMKKSDVTGAISKVSSKELTAIPLATGEQALQGRVAGVQVTAATGAPGANIAVRVRGVGSIYSDNSPLYIIDGIPSAEGMQNLSPNDIQDISILKDASSAAIYGSRATNGVVLITTKQGVSGEQRITYNGNVNVQQAVNLVEMTNTSEYVELYNEATTADNEGTTLTRQFITDDIFAKLADEDHVAAIFRTALMHSHELSVSGGSEKIKYLVSGSYYDQDGIILNSGYNRATLRTNISAKPKNWLNLGLNINGSYSDTQSISSSGDGYGNSYGGSVVRYAMFRNPAIPIKDESGNYIDKPSTYFGDAIYDTFFGDGYNPVALAKNTDRHKYEKTLFAKMNADIILPAGFDINTNFGIDYRNYDEKVYNKSWGDDYRINNPNSLSITNTENRNWTFNSTLNYHNTFGENHVVSALAGFEANKEAGEVVSNSDQDFPVWDKDVIYIGNGMGEKESDQSEWAATLASFFLQANYNYAGRYFLSGTLREDGSSRFTKENRWGTFYAFSAGWNIAKEPFMADQQLFNTLKLRVGYGAIGNQNVGIYAYTDHYSANYNYPFGGTSSEGYALTQLGNDNLKWETSRQLNAGVDMEFLDGALAFSVDYYYKVTDDMLMQASYPISVGNASSPWINSGSILNTGVDFEAMYHMTFPQGRFDVTLNGGYLHNEVLEIDAPIYSGRVDNGIYATKTDKGHPVGAFYMYKMEGIFQDETEILTSAYQGSTIQPGDVKFKDVNQDGTITSDDREYVGSAIPKFTLGLNLSAEWKNFDAQAFFYGAFGQKIYNQILTDCEGFYRGFNVTKRYYDNRWTSENPSNKYPRASWRAKSNNARVSTRFLEDGSFLRLKNLQVGYTFRPERMRYIDRLRVYLSATNLFTLTKYSGFDPEMTVSLNAESEDFSVSGIDWGTYPTCRMFTLGVNLSF